MPTLEAERLAIGEPPGPEAAVAVVPRVAKRGTASRSSFKDPLVYYLGFRTTNSGREYSLRVTGGSGPRLFVVLITHEVFATGQARFQDAPDLCFSRLQRDLAADPNLLPGSTLVLTAQELLTYRHAREKRPPVPTRRSPASEELQPAIPQR